MDKDPFSLEKKNTDPNHCFQYDIRISVEGSGSVKLQKLCPSSIAMDVHFLTKCDKAFNSKLNNALNLHFISIKKSANWALHVLSK